jgi:hypothetical protein
MSEADRFFPYFAVPFFGPQPDNRDVSRAYVREGLCPICGAGPFAVVALHVQRKHDVDKDELRGRWEAGLSLFEIGQQFGIHSKTVREGLERLGMDLGRETLRRRKNWSAEGLEQGRESHRRRMAEVQRRRVEQFNAGGGTWETVEQMARRDGVTCKSMRTALARAGADVPDGRAASSARFGKGDARRGRINPHRGLTPDQVEEIRRLHSGGGVTQRDLAELYGVSGSMISRAVRGKYVSGDTPNVPA